jgi:hypothetical protein
LCACSNRISKGTGAPQSGARATRSKALPIAAGQCANEVVQLQSYQPSRYRIGRFTGSLDQEVDADRVMAHGFEQRRFRPAR